MLGGFYTIASGMMVQQRKLEVQGNNLVNAQTPGFHAQRVVASSFSDELATTRLEYRNTEEIGPTHPITVVDTVSTIMTSGDIRETERYMDVAINGTGYYRVNGGAGVTYLTRNGGFDVDEEGYLMIPELGRVLGEDGEIQVGNTQFTVLDDGTVNNSEGETVGRLQTYTTPDGVEMTQYRNGIFGVPQGTNLQPQETTQFMQGYLEYSNVDQNREMTMLMEAQSSFVSCSTALQIIDQINQKAAQQIASL